MLSTFNRAVSVDCDASINPLLTDCSSICLKIPFFRDKFQARNRPIIFNISLSRHYFLIYINMRYFDMCRNISRFYRLIYNGCDYRCQFYNTRLLKTSTNNYYPSNRSELLLIMTIICRPIMFWYMIYKLIYFGCIRLEIYIAGL